MLSINIFLLIIGFVGLIKGADWFVDGSSALAKRFNVSPLIIGLTIVALGTSAPELAVSTLAAVEGSNEIAVSNVMGSNIFNLLCVLGVCSLIKPIPVNTRITKRDFPISIIITLFVIAGTSIRALLSKNLFQLDVSEKAGVIGRPVSITLLVLFVCYIGYMVYDSKKHPVDDDDDIPSKPLWKSVLLILIGIALIASGGQAVVSSAKVIAKTLGMTETLIGLTVVAVGTSLPELVTSIVAARKGQTDMAVGNVIGSNIFNMMFILGVSSTIHPVAVNAASLFDMLILTAVSIIVFAFSLTGKRINRAEGAVMLLIYIADVAFAIVR